MGIRPLAAAVLSAALLAGLTACVDDPPPPPPESVVVASFTDPAVGWQAYSNHRIAQAFTLPATTTVTRVSAAFGLVEFLPEPSPLPVRVDIHAADENGFPTGPVLATGTWDGPTGGFISDVDLAAPVQLAGGTRYTIVATPSNDGYVGWYLGVNDDNAGGATQKDGPNYNWRSISGQNDELTLVFQVWGY
jgi:hypothetical protein